MRRVSPYQLAFTKYVPAARHGDITKVFSLFAGAGAGAATSSFSAF